MRFGDSGRSSRRVIGNLLVAGDSFTFFLELGLQLCSITAGEEEEEEEEDRRDGVLGLDKCIKMREGIGEMNVIISTCLIYY